MALPSQEANHFIHVHVCMEVHHHLHTPLLRDTHTSHSSKDSTCHDCSLEKQHRTSRLLAKEGVVGEAGGWAGMPDKFTDYLSMCTTMGTGRMHHISSRVLGEGNSPGEQGGGGGGGQECP